MVLRYALVPCLFALTGCFGLVAPPDPTSEAGVADAGSSEAEPPVDAGSDVVTVAVDAETPGFSLEIGSMDQDCYPHADLDPFLMVATLKITNLGSQPMGPLQKTARASLVDANDVVVSTFWVELGSVDPISPGATKAVFVGKLDGTLSPRDHCGNRCGQPYRVAIDLVAPTLPAVKVVSDAFVVKCT